MSKSTIKHLVIPDVQAAPGVPLDHLRWAGNYIVKKKPDVIVCIGDFADMESLSSYDVGKKSFEGRRYTKDIEVAHEAMNTLLEPIRRYNKEQKRLGKKQYTPRMVMTMGNHDDARINRAIQNDSKLEGLISVDDLKYKEFGWEVYDFLIPVTIDGVVYSHYFPVGAMGKPCSSAQQSVNKLHMSNVAGHRQTREVAYGRRADGKRITSIVAGAFYQHDEKYMDYISNRYWRGLVMLHDVDDGEFDEMFVSIDFLKKKYDY